MTKVFQGQIMLGTGDLIATIDNQSYHITSDHPMYSRLFEAYSDKDADAFVEFSNIQQSMKNYTGASTNASNNEGLVMQGEQIFYNGVELNNAIVETIRTMMYSDMDFQPMLKFLERAIKSNSKRVIDELFKFLQACRLTITEDGCFLAYKTVGPDYYDKYTNTILNTVGADIQRKERWDVDDNCNITCSKGYHVGALAYAGPGGSYNASNDHVMICKVAPEDVVSVPVDYNGQKLRCCWYEVVGEFQGELKPTVYSGKVGANYATPPDPKRQLFYLQPEDMRVDGIYKALYEGALGESRWRYFVVLETRENNILAELMEPEEDAGMVRRFNFDRFKTIHEWDGIIADEEDDYDDEEEDYNDDEEEEDEEDYNSWN